MAIRINRVYTRGGDRGTTHLVGGAEVAKDSPRIEAFGTVDELNAILGLVRTFNEQALAAGASGAAGDAARELEGILMGLQNELFDLGSQLATPPGSEYPGMLVIGDAEVVSVVFSDDAEDVAEFFDEKGGDWPVVRDDDGRIATDWGVTGVPESYLVAPDGSVRAKIVGGIRVERLEELLAEARGA